MDEYDNYIDFYLENPENDAQRAREKFEYFYNVKFDDLLKMVEN